MKFPGECAYIYHHMHTLKLARLTLPYRVGVSACKDQDLTTAWGPDVLSGSHLGWNVVDNLCLTTCVSSDSHPLCSSSNPCGTSDEDVAGSLVTLLSFHFVSFTQAYPMASLDQLSIRTIMLHDLNMSLRQNLRLYGNWKTTRTRRDRRGIRCGIVASVASTSVSCGSWASTPAGPTISPPLPKPVSFINWTSLRIAARTYYYRTERRVSMEIRYL
ncbi:hypothetical protein CONLIGDRAFT_427868 [Coniochaeta ligniaria NRRL 30616]|uniref:Uncharacterized protein n=1 Tax=Coniochaeta ligniaria NRRL 30616 TaxID=1408157 RepID=A0A1J7IIW5_9PEZI|nr:hypothetical protein CONLIGDRAFT_427868 [Coniochaeta ligniaria NRRL 30616]